MTQPPSMGPAPIVAPRVDSTRWYSGASIALDIRDLTDGIANYNWVEGGIGALGTGAEVVGAIVDPIGALASWGVGWAMEHIRPLSRFLDVLAGDPDQVTAYAQSWRNIGTVTNSTAELYYDEVSTGTPHWQDSAHEAYRALAATRLEGFYGLKEAADGMAKLTTALHMVVNAVRSGIRAIISLVVGRIISWAIEEGATLGVATPLVVDQAMALIGQATVKVTKMLHDLFASLKKLHEALDAYKKLITALKIGTGMANGRYAYQPYHG